MAWKCLRTTGSRVGSSGLSSSTRSESAPCAFQFAIARTAFCVSAYVGSTSSDIGSPICDLAPGGGGGGAFLRCCTFSAMDGWSAGDLVLSKLPKNLSHRRRMPPLSRSRLPFSSSMACCPSVSRPGPPSFSGVCIDLSCRGVGVVSLVPPVLPQVDLYTLVDRRSHFLARSSKCFPRCRGVFGLALSACLSLFVGAAKRAALTAGRSHHPSLREVRLVSGRTSCPAPKMASVNSLASSATLARWLAISLMLSTNFRITRSRRNLVFNWLLPNGRGCGVCRTGRLWANRPPRSTVANTMLWSESALIGRFGCGCTSTLCTLGRCAWRVRM